MKVTKLTRIISIILTLSIIIGMVPALAYEDEDAPVPAFETCEAKYTVTELKYYYIIDGETYTEISSGITGLGLGESKGLMVPDGREFIFEFIMERTQDVRLELWDETGTQYLGLIAAGSCEGQWGLIGEEGWYNDTTGEGEETPVANRLAWDGSYWDTQQKAFVAPGIGALDWDGTTLEFNFIIRFQPTDESTSQFTSDIPVQVSYTAFLQGAQLRDNMDARYANLFYWPEISSWDGLVYMPSGNFMWDYPDMAVYGAQPLGFARYYNSLDDRESELGFGWRHSYSTSLDVGYFFATVHMADGYRFNYLVNRGGTFKAAAGNLNTLEASGDGYVFTTLSKTKYTFDSDGRLMSVEDVHGNTTEIARNGDTLLSVSNPSGTLYFSYNNGKLNKVTDHTGRSVTYSYNSTGDLVSFKNADGDTIDYTYADHRMTKVSDFNGITYITNQYDETGCITGMYLTDQGGTAFAYDFPNHTASVTEANGALTTYTFGTDQKVTSVEDFAGQTLYGYTSRQPSSITDRLGNSTFFDYDDGGNITGITYPDGETEHYSYNDLGLVTEMVNKDGTTVHYGYDSRGNLTSYKDAKGNVSRFTYDSDNNLLKAEDALHNVYTYTHDYKGNVLTVTDPLYAITAYAYDLQGRPVLQTNDDGSTTGYEFSPADKLLSITDASGKSAVYAVNGNGYYTGYSDWMGYASYAAYDAQNRQVSVTDALGNTTSYNYDSTGNMISVSDALGNTVGYSYDLAGRMTSMTDALGNTTTYSYDAEGRMVSVVDPLHNTTSTSYSETGRTVSYTDANGGATSYEYDLQGRVTRVTNDQGKYTFSAFDDNGNLIKSRDRNGNIWQYSYDENDRLVEAKDPLGYITVYSYDDVGRQTKTVTALNNQSQTEYDSMGRVKKTIDAEGYETSYEYDILGRMVKTINADLSFTTYSYNANGWLTSSRDEADAVTSYTFNNAGQILTMTDALGGVTSYGYDALGRTVSVTDPMNCEVSYVYDACSNLLSSTDAGGHTTSYTYDELNRVATKTDAAGGITTFGYDANGNNTSVSAPGGGVTQYVYDSLDRLIEIKDAENKSTTFSYDGNGNRLTVKDGRNNTETTVYDELNRPVSVTDALGGATHNVYDADGRLIEFYDKNNNKWAYGYDGNGRLISMTDPLLCETSYVYDSMGRTTVTVSASGSQSKSYYDAAGRLIKSVDAMERETLFEYDMLGRLVRKVNADGTEILYQYNLNGWLVQVTHEDGSVTMYTHDDTGRILTVTDALGGITGYGYDALGRTTTVVDALGGVTSSSYDLRGNLISTTDALGNETLYSYDLMDRLVSTTNALGGITLVEYDAAGNVTKVTNPDGGEIYYVYDAVNRLIACTDSEGYTSSFSYDANGNAVSETDGRGTVWHTGYDALNRVVRKYVPLDASAPFGTYYETIYDADGRVVETIDAMGVSTFYQYDLTGNVLSVTDGLQNETVFTYDSMNRVQTMVDARGAVTSYTYTATGQVETITNALGGVRSFEYDMLGRVTKETDELGHTVKYSYDALGHVLTVTNQLGKVDTFTYDLMGRIKTVADKKGNTTTYFYDAAGNIVETKDALSNSSYFEYDSMNQLVKVTLYRKNARQNVNEEQITLYQYDKRGLVTKEINAAGLETEYEYDGNGNLVLKLDADGYVTEYGYDPRNLVESINYINNNGGTSKEALFTYNANGELTEMEDWNGVASFALDVLGRITSVNDHNNKTVGYAYDAVGNQTSIAYPDSSTVLYTYDLLGRLTNVKDEENQNTTYGYDAASRLISMSYPNGWNETNTYDAAGQLLSQVQTDPTNTPSKTVTNSYVYDNQGNITGEVRTGNGGGQAVYNLTHAYDALNRLVSTTVNSGSNGIESHTYTYDSLGNLVYELKHNKGTEYWYNGLNQMVQKKVDNKDVYVYEFDNRGNLTEGVYIKNKNQSSVVESYYYDETNRMVKGTNSDGESSEYIFNGFGHLVGQVMTIKKNAYGYTNVGTVLPPQSAGNVNTVVSKSFVLDYTSPLAEVILETESGGGGLTYRYVYGLEKLSVSISPILNGAGSIVQNGRVKLWYHKDRLGSTDYLTDNVQGKVTSYTTYDSWGEPLMKTIIKLGSRELDLANEYTGHPYDPVLGVYYARARMYDSGDRRFMAEDPIWHPGVFWVTGNSSPTEGYYLPIVGRVMSKAPGRDGLDLYLYCLNNPIVYHDPSGLNRINSAYTHIETITTQTYWRKIGPGVSVEITAEEYWKSTIGPGVLHPSVYTVITTTTTYHEMTRVKFTYLNITVYSTNNYTFHTNPSRAVNGKHMLLQTAGGGLSDTLDQVEAFDKKVGQSKTAKRDIASASVGIALDLAAIVGALFVPEASLALSVITFLGRVNSGVNVVIDLADKDYVGAGMDTGSFITSELSNKFGKDIVSTFISAVSIATGLNDLINAFNMLGFDCYFDLQEAVG